MKIYLATWLEDNQGVTLTEAGYEHRLLSYFFIDNPKERLSGERKINFDLRTYVKTGLSKNMWLKIKKARRRKESNED